MLRASLAHLSARKETLAAVIGFAAASLYWLALAFVMTPDTYGRMMTIQASASLVVAILTLRTHDLVYFLIRQHDEAPRRAWHSAVMLELLAALLAAALSIVSLRLFQREALDDPVVAVVFCALAATTVFQQASVARLRYAERARFVVLADAAAVVMWLVALGSLVALPTHDPLVMLCLGAAPPATRSLVLVLAATATPAPSAEGAGSGTWPIKTRYLLEGHGVNAAKNGGTAMETLIVSVFMNPAFVAMYRLAKSAQGVASAASNVAFQQGFASLAKAPDQKRRLRIWSDVRKRGVRIALATLPLSLAFAALYAWQKPDIDPLEMQLINIGVFVGLLPAILLQGSFIVVSLAGRHRKASAAFLVGLACVLALSAVLFWIPSIWIFIVAVIVGGCVRLTMLDRAALAVIGEARRADGEAV